MFMQHNTFLKYQRKTGQAALGACLIAAVAATASLPARGDVALNSLLSDGAVLQRGSPITVFGTAADGEKIRVRMGSQVSTTVAQDGRWLVRLKPLAAGGPYTLTATGPHNTVTARDMLVGEVWVCSGQSNMGMNVASTSTGAQAIARADDPQLRLYHVPNVPAAAPVADANTQWHAATPQSVPSFSAVGYYFGRDLRKALGVPVGLIEAEWGGTPAQAWVSGSALEKLPDFQATVAAFREQQKDPAFFKNKSDAWYARHDPGSAGRTWADPAFSDMDWQTINQPVAFSKSANPAFSAPFQGVAWFRKVVDVPTAFVGKDLTLLLGPIDDGDTTYFNGVKVGSLSDWQQNRDYTVPAALVKPGRNVIAIRLLNRDGDGGIYGKPEQLSLQATGRSTALPLAGPWRYKIGTPLPGNDPVPTDNGLDPFTAPAVLYNGMIAPLTRYGIRGVVWYQGESNTYNPVQYRTLFPTLIADWRSHWGEGNLPFYFVQLAPFMSIADQPQKSAWAELREVQRLTVSAVPNTAMAVITDVGDTHAIHPTRKAPVGDRLARNAEALVYRLPVEYSGPKYTAMTITGSQIVLRFTHAAGLHTQAVQDGNGTQVAPADTVTGFAVAGADGKYVNAGARIVGDKVAVSSPQVAVPVAVRYGWADYPLVNLYNTAGLPASPFETEPFPNAKP